MKLFVVRHGETNENIGKIMQGNMDTVLNEKGREQAKIARDKLALENIDVIYASPKSRTRETAEIISDGKIEILYDDRLKSRNHGEFEGMDRRTINLKDYWNYNLNMQYQSAESIRNLYDRVSNFLDMIKEKHNNQTVLIVTHSGVCRILYYYFNGLPSDGDMLSGYEALNGLIEKYEL